MHNRILGLAPVTALLLLIPLVAMQFTSEVNWSPFDFVFAGTLIFGTGLAYELAVKKMKATLYRAAVASGLAAVFLLIWIRGAVGLIGNEDHPANALYLAVLMVGLLGTFIARLQPQAMAFTLFAMALAQVVVPVIAVVVWQPEDVMKVVGVNAFFVTLFAVSGLLFRQVGE